MMDAESQATGQPSMALATAADIVLLYRELLGRAPESDSVVSARIDRPLLEVAVEVARSQEFRAHSRATTVADVIALYRSLLRREPESDAVVTPRIGRPILDVALEIAQSAEFCMHSRTTTTDDVIALYRSLLLREPEEKGVVSPRIGRPLLEVAIEIAQSEEFLRSHLFQATSLKVLYEAFCLTSDVPVEWYYRFSRVLSAHGISLGQLLAYFQELALHARGLSSGYPEVEQSLIRLRQPFRNIGSKIKIVVPTINSGRWLGYLIDYYHQMQVPVVFAVDARTTDNTREVLLERDSEFIEVCGDHPRVESLMQDIVSKIDAPWLLRFDDDEVPSPALLAFADEAIKDSADVTWGFPRVYLRYDEAVEELQYSQFLPVSSIGGADRQWRLFAKTGVTLVDALHTPGFVATRKKAAPADAVLFHFDWVLRSLAERLKKVRGYEAQDAVPARALAHLCLYEMIPESWHMFRPLTYGPCVTLARQMLRAKGQSC